MPFTFSGIDYIVNTVKPDGILTTKSNVVAHAYKNNISVIQRFFILDSLSYEKMLLNIKENIELSCNLLTKKPDHQWLGHIISQLNVTHLLNHYPKQLSIGERQRVSFIRSIAHQPTVLLADEPTAALDPKNAEVLFDIIVRLVRENHLSALIVTHDWDLLDGLSIPSIQGKVTEQRAIFTG